MMDPAKTEIYLAVGTTALIIVGALMMIVWAAVALLA